MTVQAKIESMTGKEVVVSRLIDAPRERVFDAWVKPEKLAQWWGPKGFTNARCEIDPRPGGKIRIDMIRDSGARSDPAHGLHRRRDLYARARAEPAFLPHILRNLSRASHLGGLWFCDPRVRALIPLAKQRSS
jgi:hypothetical protein